MARSRKNLGEILVGWGAVTAKQAEEATTKSKSGGKRLHEVLMEMGVKEEQVYKAMASEWGMEYVDLNAGNVAVDPKLIPEELVKKHLILPMVKTNGRLSLIVHDPGDLELQDMLRFRLNAESDP